MDLTVGPDSARTRPPHPASPGSPWTEPPANRPGWWSRGWEVALNGGAGTARLACRFDGEEAQVRPQTSRRNRSHRRSRAARTLSRGRACRTLVAVGRGEGPAGACSRGWRASIAFLHPHGRSAYRTHGIPHSEAFVGRPVSSSSAANTSRTFEVADWIRSENSSRILAAPGNET